MDAFTRTVYVTIAWLKRKLGEPQPIHTTRGIRYHIPLRDERKSFGAGTQLSSIRMPQGQRQPARPANARAAPEMARAIIRA
jgi:hypothetical protein